jgi:hypothetical protein
MPIPHAKLPRGSAGRIPNVKNTAPKITNRRFRCTHDFIKSQIPAKQNTAPIQTRGSNKTSKTPIDLLPPPEVQTAVVMHKNTKI